jgi:pimeloyl-ACP methyl ester carboxylesterase
VRVDEHTTEVAGAPLFYRSAEWTGVPALYLHGIPTSSDDWTAFLEQTGGLAPDLPGFGRSSKAGNLDYTIDGHADFVERFLAELGVERVRLVAHDWGAGGGLVFAQRHPDRVERLVLCNALPLLEGFRWHRLGRTLRRPLLGELLMGSTTRWLLARALRGGSARAGAWTEAQINAVWEQFDQGTQRAILRLHRSADEQRLAAAGAELESIESRALVIWGERDPWLEPGYADAYGARLPRAEVQRITEAGHWPWLDNPRVVERITSFLQTA